MQDPKKYAYYELAHKILAVFKRIGALPSRRVGTPRKAQRYAEDF